MKEACKPAAFLFLGLVACSAPRDEADRWSEPYVRDYELAPVEATPVAYRAPVAPVTRDVRVQDPELFRLAAIRLPGLTVNDEASLKTLMASIAAIAGTSIVVDEAAEQAALDEGVVFDLDLTRSIPLLQVLNLVTDLAGSEVVWELRHGVVFVTTPDRLSASMKTRIYDVSDLTYGVPSFRAPMIGDLRSPEDIPGYDEPELIERTAVFDEDELLTLIIESVSPEAWDDAGASITIENGKLIVRHR